MERSNIQLKSNIYVRKNEILSHDSEYVQHVTGYKRLKEIAKQLGTLSSVQLNREQNKILSDGMSCHELKNGEQAYGMVRENDGVVLSCRCEKTDCYLYEKCMSAAYAKRIERPPVQLKTTKKRLPEDPVDAKYEQIHVCIHQGTPFFQQDQLERELEQQQKNEVRALTEEQHREESRSDFTESVQDYRYQKVMSPECIIHSDISSHILLNSGPGTGKTYTIIQRLLYLLKNQLCDPADILVLCYTRAARNVIMERIETMIVQGILPVEASTVCVLTFDSYASYFLLDNAEELKLNCAGMDYNQRIDAFNQNVIREDFEHIAYLIVDELQDLVNVRAEMVLKILQHISCGFLLAGDKCQAIYDFEAEKQRDMDSVEFYRKLEQHLPHDLQKYEISVNHRQTSELQKASDEMRQVILTKSIYEQNQYTQDMIKSYEKEARSVESWIKKYEPTSVQKTAILCRNNGEAAYIDALLCQKRIPHRLCSSQTETGNLHRWIADVFWDYCSPQIGRTEFIERYCQRVETDEEKADVLWKSMTDAAGKEQAEILDMAEIRRILHSSSILPGDFLADQDADLTVSTIHRAKGLEFDAVYLLASPIDVSAKHAEEVRTRYVAVTRAKNSFHILKKGDKKEWFFKKAPSGRWIRTRRHFPKTQVYCASIAFGGTDDCNPFGFVLSDFDSAMQCQQYLAEQVKSFDPVRAMLDDTRRYYIILHTDQTGEEHAIGRLALHSAEEFLDCVGCTDYKYNIPSELTQIYVRDLVTVAAGNFSDEIPEEMRSSGIWLGISVTGMARTVFRKGEK